MWPNKTTPLKVQVIGPDEDDCKDNVLFVHGWPDSGDLFADQAAFLSDRGYRLGRHAKIKEKEEAKRNACCILLALQFAVRTHTASGPH